MQIDGTSEQIEFAKQLVNEVISDVCVDLLDYLLSYCLWALCQVILAYRLLWFCDIFIVSINLSSANSPIHS